MSKPNNVNTYCTHITPKFLSYKQFIYKKKSKHIYWDDIKGNENTICDKSIRIEVKLISSPPLKPVIFGINNILSHKECDIIIKLINFQLNKNKTVTMHQKNNGPSFYRLYRNKHLIFDNIFCRIGDILDIDEKLLNIFCATYYNANTEMIGHYDQCNCTLIIYLNNVSIDQGGRTIFPKANMKLHAGKGNALLFYSKKYNLKEVDPFSFHSGGKLLYGKKYIIMLQW
eukprot:477348_1